MSPRVTVIAKTEFLADAAAEVMCGFRTDANGGEALVEAAGRACYQSWAKPNPETANNAGYINNIKDHRHFSVLEHGTVSIYFEGISRTLSHELIRHRHFSYSELSQRYVNMLDAESVMHPTLSELIDTPGFERTKEDINTILFDLQNNYEALVTQLNSFGITGKKAREAARGYMAANLETKIVVTGNYRAWRHWLVMRASEHADAEIRNLAIETFVQLLNVAPNIFDDFDFKFGKNREIIGVHSPYMEIS